MEQEKIIRVSGRDRDLVWLGGFLGAIFAKLLDSVVSSLQAPSIVPEIFRPVTNLAMWSIAFLLMSILLTFTVLWILSKTGFLRTR